MSDYTALSSKDDEQETKDVVYLLPMSGTSHSTLKVSPPSRRSESADYSGIN